MNGNKKPGEPLNRAHSAGRSIQPSLNRILRAFGLDVRNAISHLPAIFMNIAGNWAGNELLKRGILALNNPA